MEPQPSKSRYFFWSPVRTNANGVDLTEPHIAVVTEDVKKYDFIDALRGYAILGVLFDHASQFVGAESPMLRSLLAEGAHGVQLFFIASALTLALSAEERQTHEQSPLRNFYLRRLFRIAPMFYIAIGLYLSVYGFSPRYWAPDGIGWWSVWLTVTFLNGFLPETINSVVPGGWSIAVEMNFYLVLPVLLRWFTSLRSRVILFIAVLAVSVVAKYGLRVLFGPYFPPREQYLVVNFSGLNLLAHLPIFALGLIIHALFKVPSRLRRVVWWGGGMYFALVAACLLSREPIRLIDNPICIGIGLALVTGFLAVNPTTPLVNRVVVWIGRVSFSMYLIHFAVLAAFAKTGLQALFVVGDWTSIAYCLCLLGVTSPLAHMCYQTIEQRGVRAGKKLIERLGRRDLRGDAPEQLI